MTTLRAVSKEEFRSSDNISTCEQIRTRMDVIGAGIDVMA